MNRIVQYSLALAVAALMGCGGRPTYSPDGGRERQVCTAELIYANVKVVDASGNPVEGVTVTGRNLPLNKSSTGVTNSQGLTTSVAEDLGPGTVTVSGSVGTRVTDVKQVQFVCGECHCAAEPSQVTLTLQ